MCIMEQHWKYRNQILSTPRHIWTLVLDFIRHRFQNRQTAVVNIYEIGELSEYRVKKFYDTDREWLKFVVECRDGRDIYKEYDVVIGNVANDDVFKCVSMYMDGIWNEERTLNEIRYYKKNDQIAFLTQEVIDSVMKFQRSYEVLR